MFCLSVFKREGSEKRKEMRSGVVTWLGREKKRSHISWTSAHSLLRAAWRWKMRSRIRASMRAIWVKNRTHWGVSCCRRRWYALFPLRVYLPSIPLYSDRHLCSSLIRRKQNHDKVDFFFPWKFEEKNRNVQIHTRWERERIPSWKFVTFVHFYCPICVGFAILP